MRADKEDSHMGDNRTDLPEGTDAIIAGASNVDDTTDATGAESDACPAMAERARRTWPP